MARQFASYRESSLVLIYRLTSQDSHLVAAEGQHRKKVISIKFKMATSLCRCYQVSASDFCIKIQHIVFQHGKKATQSVYRDYLNYH